MSESISEKAKALKSKVEIEMKTEEDERIRIRTENLKEKLTSEKAVKESQNKKNNAVSQKRSEIEKLITDNKKERNTLQAEVKSVARDLRADEAGKEVLKNEDYRRELFGDTIAKLKEINEATKSYRTELKQVLDEAKKERDIYTQAKQERLNEFLANHPELRELQGKAKIYEDWFKSFEEQEKKVEDFANNPEIKAHLGDEIFFDKSGYHRVVDKTLIKQQEELDKRLSEFRDEIHKAREDVYKVKKGFFESQKDFEKKTNKMWEDIIQRSKDGEKEIFDGEKGIRNTSKLAEEIQEKLSHFLMNMTHLYDRKETAVTEAKTVGGLVELCKKDLAEQKKKYTLLEEEQLLLELNRELWS